MPLDAENGARLDEQACKRRTMADIEADLAVVGAEHERIEARLDALRLERAEALKAREAAMIADFDAGKTIMEVSHRHGVTYAVANKILWLAGRKASERRIPRTLEQMRLYKKGRRTLGYDREQAREFAGIGR